MSDNETLDQVNHRLNNFEGTLKVFGQKIDSLSEAVVAVARMDERIVAVLDNMEAHDKHIDTLYGLDRAANERMNKLENERISALEKKFAAESGATGVVRGVFWIVFTALVTSIVGGIGYLLFNSSNYVD